MTADFGGKDIQRSRFEPIETAQIEGLNIPMRLVQATPKCMNSNN